MAEPFVKITVPTGWMIAAGKEQVRAVMRGAGNEIAARARALIRAGSATKKRAAKRASAAGGPPVSRTGNLARSIKIRLRRDGEGVTVRDTAETKGAYYAQFLELGARNWGSRISNPYNLGHMTRKGWVAKRVNPRKESSISRRTLLPHPFMIPALDQVIANGLADRVRDAVVSGMKFQRGKY
jgi:Bacteriophage HK97-gp10, putative tail-component